MPLRGKWKDRFDRPEPELYPTGHWSIGAVADTSTWHNTQKDDAKWLSLVFDGRDWVFVFCKTLGLSGDDEISMRESFAAATSQYPMLGRLYDLYEDVTYEKEEIMVLLAECSKVRKHASDPSAFRAMESLAVACREALRLDLGLYFACP